MKLMPASRARLDVRVYGQVQGVGFRPYVHGLAHELGLTGWVRNDERGVRIEVQGNDRSLRDFLEGVRRGPSTLARVESVEVSSIGSLGEAHFDIVGSTCGGARTMELPPDSAVCAACLAELFDRDDHRYRYAFINCTECGPRYTITHALPFDRERTSMSEFSLCNRCCKEYTSADDRRFHAEATACGVCGPRLELRDADGAGLGGDAISETIRMLRSGAIVAIKSLGGFHLACDARNAAAVSKLRARKRREARPFGLMVLNPASLAPYTAIDQWSLALLESPERPLVLVEKRRGCDAQLAGVAPGVNALGVMLPYTPIHYLLFHEAAGRPDGTDWLRHGHPLVLVMTSANLSGEPLVTDNDEALERLDGIADGFLLHNRDIVASNEDSVIQGRGDGTTFIRRARGFVPAGIRLPAAGPSVLALGAGLKNTVCLTRGARAYLSPHIGDLGNLASTQALEQCVDHLLELFELQPQSIAHDLHPDYPSTQLAARLAETLGIPSVGVQHHHAHVAAVAAEHGLEGDVLGVALDGVGLGSDGGAWGGELLRVGHRCERLGHLKDLPLPGGDRAAREPWRMAVSVLHALGEQALIATRYPGEPAEILQQMLVRDFNCPPTSSAGRLFDAAAALLGVRSHNRFEAEAAMNLEALANAYGTAEPLSDSYTITTDNQLDLLPLFAALLDIEDERRGAALFHATFAAGLAEWVTRSAEATGADRIALAGGCFLNTVLTDALTPRLEARGLTVYQAHQTPPNDGGLSLGQAWVAVMRANDRS